MNLPDVTELRDLIRHMPPAERDELRRAIFGGEWDLTLLACHELERFTHLLKKLEAAWPYCEGQTRELPLLEMLVTFDDDEMRDFLNLHRWALGDERPADHPFTQAKLEHYPIYGKSIYRPDQPLSEAQRILSGGGATT